MHAPLFWKEKTRLSTLLLPLAAVYGWCVRCRQKKRAQRLDVPVLCVGNLVAGGAGKTPVALALGALLKQKNIRAGYLSRGYGGSLKGPVQVDEATHTAAQVGDEPLLLAQVLPTWVAADRVAGGKAMEAAHIARIIMDDGFQNPALHKDISLLVIDGDYGFGNERLIPAGPLREPITCAMQRASAIVLIGEDKHLALRHAPKALPVLRARLEPLQAAKDLKDRKVLAFAGIARPIKFYRTLQQLGCRVRKMVAYPDHHAFTPKDLVFLRSKAKELQATLVTTTKDYVRLPQDMQQDVTVVAVEVVFEDPTIVSKIVLS